MRFLVWNMRWMTRHLGSVARPVVRWWGAHEVIACGLRSGDGEVRIIYTPPAGHSGHRVRVRSAGEARWSTSPHDERENFSGSVVRTVAVPGASSGTALKMAAENARGKTLSSPAIIVKPETVSEPELLDIAPVPSSPDGAVLFSWPKAEANDPMIYFFALEDAYGKTCAAVYTRESFWRYPHTQSASYSVGPSAPPRLTAGETYTATLTLVDYDGWASHSARRQFSTGRVDGGTLS